MHKIRRSDIADAMQNPTSDIDIDIRSNPHADASGVDTHHSHREREMDV